MHYLGNLAHCFSCTLVGSTYEYTADFVMSLSSKSKPTDGYSPTTILYQYQHTEATLFTNHSTSIAAERPADASEVQKRQLWQYKTQHGSTSCVLRIRHCIQVAARAILFSLHSRR